MPVGTRRTFLRHSAAASLSAVAATCLGSAAAEDGNSRLTLGIIGCGKQGAGLAEKFSKLADVAYVCDPDAARRGQLRSKIDAGQDVSDLRRVLDDPAIDAVVVATPDHWHAPIALMACAAGKHVYVEKPQSHNLRESRLLVDAARRYQRIVQHGTQSRSNPLIAGAVKLLHEGIIGDVLIARAWNIQQRENIGHLQPSVPPTTLDYDLWVGPAEYLPYQENRLHYNWRWWHNFGTGDIGNDGTHEIDYARWGLGVTGLPSTVVALGGKYSFDDDQQFPDTATCAFEWPGEGGVGHRRQLTFEMRLWNRNYPFNCDSGVEFLGTSGRMLLSKRGKVEIFDERNQRIEKAIPSESPLVASSHQADFLEAIREGRMPAADVAIGHDSVALVHLANVALKVNRSLHVDPVREVIVDDTAANALLSRTYREGGHWAIPRGVPS